MDKLALFEKEKYEKVWGYDDYRNKSPGEHIAEQAFEILGSSKNDTWIDFGCGTGRPALILKELGANITAIDHTEKCLDKTIKHKLNFIEASLWDLPDIEADYGYCTDVMEHIPTGKVHDVLNEINRVIKKAVFFQISTRPDSFGKKIIGSPLHLTVWKSEKWKMELSKYWTKFKVLKNSNDEYSVGCFK